MFNSDFNDEFNERDEYVETQEECLNRELKTLRKLANDTEKTDYVILNVRELIQELKAALKAETDDSLVLNPKVVKTKGRVSKLKRKSTSQLVCPARKKVRKPPTCSICGLTGHNKANRKLCSKYDVSRIQNERTDL